MAQSSQTVSRGPWRILILSIVLFAVSVFIFLGIQFGYLPYLDNEAQALDQELATLNQTFQGEKQEDVFNLFSQIYNVQELFQEKTSLAQITEFLEGVTHPSVVFEEVQFDVVDESVVLKGETNTFETVVSQLNILGSSENVESVVLDNSTKTEDGIVSFTINLKVTPLE